MVIGDWLVWNLRS